jgi:site-specific recombinase XerD
VGKKQRDCADCGAPVGFLGRERCCLCVRRAKEAAAKACCPECSKDRVLLAATGKCVLCSRRCSRCGGPVRAAGADVCRGCLRRAEREAAKSLCPRCSKAGFLREATGLCGSCSRPGPPKGPPRVCWVCGELRRHSGLGMCSRCWQRHPDRPFIMAQNLAARLNQPPEWLPNFTAHLSAGNSVGRACIMITALGRLLDDGQPQHPQALLERARRPGRSMGSLARAMEEFFTKHAMAVPTDQTEHLAAGRRQRRIMGTPEALRDAIIGFEKVMLYARERARRSGTRPRADHTLETALATMRDFARFLDSDRHKHDWALTDVHDVEAFLTQLPSARRRRLAVIGQFFRFARAQRLILVDPTRGLNAREPRGFRSATLTLQQQRVLFRRWTNEPDTHPHEALLGILALLHGASNQEIRLLPVNAIDTIAHTIRLGRRPHPVPLDPASWAVLQRCLRQRETLATSNPHVVVTRCTKAGSRPASTAYFTHLLDSSGFAPRTIRGTRLLDLVNTMDPKLVAAAFGMTPEATMGYLADHVDPDRLPALPRERRRTR